MEDILQIEKILYQFIKENTHSDISRIDHNTLLFTDGFFDSMGFVLLVDFLEEKFGIKTQDEDLVEENFESVSAIVNFIQKKLAAKAA